MSDNYRMLPRITGHIHYTSGKVGREGQERGREFFTLLRHVDGSRTMQAHCELDDPPSVVRMVTTTLDQDWRPRDAFVRIVVRDRFTGSTWYRFGSGFAECEGYTAKEGRLSQRFELARPIDSFGAHPLQGDAWVCRAYPLEQGPGTKRLNLLVSSIDHRGATGPMLIPLETDLHFVGRAEVRVGAGTFNALHFRFGQDGDWAADDELRHPMYHLWCTADGEFVFLKGEVAGYMQTRYELVSLHRAGEEPART